MLRININTNHIKKQEHIKLHSFSLRRNIPCIISDSSIESKDVFKYIQKNHSCVFQQQNGVLDTSLVQSSTAFITCENICDKHMHVKKFIRMYSSDVDGVLKQCHMQDKRYTRMSQLSQIEYITLQLNVHLARKPFLWIFDGSWDLLEDTLKQYVQQCIYAYFQENGCYILTTASSKSLFSFHETISLQEEPQEDNFVSYLEEDVPLYTRSIPPSHKEHSVVFGVLRTMLYTLLVFVLTTLSFCYVYTFDSAESFFEKETLMLEEKLQYPVLASFCVGDTKPSHINAECAPRNSEQVKEVLYRKTGLDLPFTSYTQPYIKLGITSYFVDEKGKKVVSKYGTNDDQVPITIYQEDKPITRGVIIQQFHDEGIYVNKQFASLYFGNRDISDMMLYAKMMVPLYTVEDSYEYYEGNEENMMLDTIPVYATYEVSLPIAGIVQSHISSNILIGQTFYDDVKKELGYGKAYTDNADLELKLFDKPLTTYENMKVYYPNAYVLFANSKEQAEFLEMSLMPSQFDLTPEVAYNGQMFTAENFKENVYNNKMELHVFLKPYIIVCFVLISLLLIYEVYSIRKVHKEKTTLQQIKKGICLLVISLSMSFVILSTLNILIQQGGTGINSWFMNVYLNSEYNPYTIMLMNTLLALSELTMQTYHYMFIFLIPFMFMILFYLPSSFIHVKCYFHK